MPQVMLADMGDQDEVFYILYTESGNMIVTSPKPGDKPCGRKKWQKSSVCKAMNATHWHDFLVATGSGSAFLNVSCGLGLTKGLGGWRRHCFAGVLQHQEERRGLCAHVIPV